jgi:hypothetical protein
VVVGIVVSLGIIAICDAMCSIYGNPQEVFMGQRMTWEEIRTKYPDQWVSLSEVDLEESGEVKTGIVVAVGPDLKSVVKESKGKNYPSHKFEYTGEIKNFLGFSKWDIGSAEIR